MTFWNDPGEDIVGIAAGCAKLVGIAEQLLNRGQLYLYHGKTVMKEPQSSGTVRWHQDYGYWYYNGAPMPDMITTITALTSSTPENGGLKVIARSNQCGRVDHIKVETGAGRTAQMEVEPDRLAMLEKILPTISLSLDPGDTVFLDCNTLHASGENVSDTRRWHLLFAYNTAANSPPQLHHHARYGDYPLRRHPADAVKQCDSQVMTDQHAYMTPDQNPFVNAT